jgi:hypothetical protein
LARTILALAVGTGLTIFLAGRAPEERAGAAERPHLRYTMHSLQSTWGDCGVEPCITLHVRFPVFLKRHDPASQDDTLNVFVQETLLGKYDPGGVRPVLDAVRDSVAAQFRALPPSAPRHPWTIDRTMTVLGDTLDILTLDVEEFRNTDGAHPTTMHLLYMLRPESMTVLTLDDIIGPGRRRLLTQLCEREFRSVRKIPPGERLSDKGFTFPGNAFTLTMNVGLTGKGILFYYNPYEIAPYDMGPTRIVIGWSKLQGLLRLSTQPR